MAANNDTSGILLVGGAMFLGVGGVWFLTTGEWWFFPFLLLAIFGSTVAAKSVTKKK